MTAPACSTTPSVDIPLQLIWAKKSSSANEIPETFDTLFGDRGLEGLVTFRLSTRTNTSSTVGGTISPLSDSRFQSFYSDLISLLKAEPVETGVDHEADRFIASAIAASPLEAGRWIKQAYQKNCGKYPAMAADILHCLGSLPRFSTQNWGIELVGNGLLHSNFEVRDAAVRTLEMWEDSDSLTVLREHLKIETDPWLKNYIEKVVNELTR